MSRRLLTLRRAVGLVLAALVGGAATLATAPAALAADDRRAVRAMPNPQYQQECAACHLAYPPGLLPKASWSRVMGGLSKHYGVDASLDAATTAELSAWLQAHAGTDRRAREAPPEDRITRSAWFIREHDEVPAATWKRPAIKSPSNCSACHTGAEQGNFNEHDVRIPR